MTTEGLPGGYRSGPESTSVASSLVIADQRQVLTVAGEANVVGVLAQATRRAVRPSRNPSARRGYRLRWRDRAGAEATPAHLKRPG